MRRKNKKFYIVLILIVLFGVSVGYAAISRVLTINGSSEVKQNTWDIHFENIQIKNGSVTATKEPTLENSNTSVNFSFMLDLPGDYYEFTVDAVNKGTIDAMIESITKTPELTTEQAKYLNYIIEYQNGEQISSKQLISKNSFVRIKVRVEFRSDVLESDMPTTNQSLDLGFTLNYVQADSTATSVKDNGVFMITANGSLDDIGTIVTIGSEQFYTIGTEGDNVKLLSMYNLYVGGIDDGSTWTAYGEEATGIQDENIRGWVYGETIRKGTTAFSNLEQHGINFTDYSGSIVEGYVNNYKNFLENNYDVNIIEARLIYLEEVQNEKIGCTSSGCRNAVSWITSTTYWTGTVQTNEGRVFVIGTDGNYGIIVYVTNYNCGVRPVIVLNKSDIVVKVKPTANGSLDDIGTIVTIGDQQFYTIGTEGNNVKLFSSMNITLEEKPIQSSSAGTTTFSSEEQHGINYSDYEGSIVEGYVNKYKTIIEEDYGIDVIEARLISKDELTSEKIGCSSSSCKNAPSFIYSTSYWSGSAYDGTYVWYVYSDGFFGYSNYLSSNVFGIRPVIVISKDYF